MELLLAATLILFIIVSSVVAYPRRQNFLCQQEVKIEERCARKK